LSEKETKRSKAVLLKAKLPSLIVSTKAGLTLDALLKKWRFILRGAFCKIKWIYCPRGMKSTFKN